MAIKYTVLKVFFNFLKLARLAV